jgi:uncharacterized repeat protein (TIGR01451 family)
MMIVLLLPLTAAAQQQEKGSIELKSISELEVVTKSAEGKKTVKRVDTGKATVVPGDTVVFTTTYRNIGAKPAEKVVITNPVPGIPSMWRRARKAGDGHHFSADGGKTPSPDKLTAKDAAESSAGPRTIYAGP